jgi:flagellar biosynthesis/type III secretory pathway chaperone
METQQLTDLIERKRQLLEMLVQVARRQNEFIAASDMTTLLKLLSAKQSLLTQLQQTERQLDPFREQDPDRRVWPAPELRQRCQEAARVCESLLAELMQIEQRDEGEMVRRRDAVAGQLQSVASAHEARAAYAFAPLGSAAPVLSLGASLEG